MPEILSNASVVESSAVLATSVAGKRSAPALVDFFEAEESGVLGFAIGLVGRRPVAEELVQEAFLRLHQLWDQVENPRAWLYRSVRNLALNHLRDHARETIMDAPERPGDEAPPDEALGRLEALGMVRMLLAKNPDLQPWIDPELEARVVAGVLGEASAFEMAELERIAAGQPELAIFRRRIEAIHGLVGEASRPPAKHLRLSDDRRRKLLATMGGLAAAGPKVSVLRRPWRARWSSPWLLRVAAGLVLGGLVATFVSSFFFIWEKETSSGAMLTARREKDFGVGNGRISSRSALPAKEAKWWNSDLTTGWDSLSINRADLGESRTAKGVAILGNVPFVGNLAKSSAASPKPVEAPAIRDGNGPAAAADGYPVEGVRQTVFNQSAADEKQAALAKTPASLTSTAVRSDALDEFTVEPVRPATPVAVSAAPAPNGMDLMPAPKITTKSGQLAQVAVVQEHESRTAEITKDDEVDFSAAGGSDFGLGAGAGGGEFASAETLARKPAENELSVRSGSNEVFPAAASSVAGTDGREKSKFDGFVNYGSPILALASPATRHQSGAQSVEIVPNVIDQPVFSTRDKKPAGETATGSEAVSKLLEEAEDYGSRGSLDLATKRYEQALSADPNNVAARQGMEKVNEVRQKYDREAYDETRSRMLWQVAQGWKLPTRKFTTGKDTAPATSSDALTAKLNRIVIPQFVLREATVGEAVDSLRRLGKNLDTQEPNPAKKGANIFLKLPPTDSGAAGARITLQLNDVPLFEALRYVAEAASMKIKIDSVAVSIVPLDAKLDETKPVTLSLPSDLAAADQPFSTFSLHVSDVSFQLARDALARGEVPDPELIRPEEFYNAFDYGDPAPAAGEEVACRIEQAADPLRQQRNLVCIAMKVAASGRNAGQPLRLTILLDTSGSMEREDRAASVRKALASLASLLGPDDRITLIGFARQPRLLAEAVPGNQAAKLVEIATRTPSEGGTNLEEALRLAAELAKKQQLASAQNRVVLLTDGAANLGNADPARLARRVEDLRQRGIAFDACGVGADGLDDDILEALTRQGDGRYYFLEKPADADAGFARQLAGAFRPAAQNVKVQVRWNPRRVGQYRLIGFEQHRLAKEDFRNDKVDAAELAVEEAGVALYQIEPLSEGEGDLGEVSVRFRDPATGAMVERSWTMPYDPKAPAFDRAPPSLQLAGLAAALAEKLRGGPGAAAVDLDSLAPILTGLRAAFPHQARVEELTRMWSQAPR